MIINRGEVADIKYLKNRPESILFYLEDGTYFYVCAGIIESQLQIMKNLPVKDQIPPKSWFIVYQQGVQIPQELGDYLVEIS